jgi:triosephosphate isomerase (TIM)
LSKISTPVVIVNFKTYHEVEGYRSLSIARFCQDVSKETGVCIAVCPPLVELSTVASSVNIPVLAQHTDPVKPGSHTGWTTPEAVKAAGASGALLNHSEHKMMLSDISTSVRLCRSATLQTVVCADSAETAGACAFLKPDFIAVEPPELIGGEVSVTNAKPEVVENAVRAVHRIDDNIPVLCGAGVKTGEDAKRAIELGARGVLLASGVVKSEDVKKALQDLVKLL